MGRDRARWLKSYWIWLVIIVVTSGYVILTGRVDKSQTRQEGLDVLAEVTDLIQQQSIMPPNMSSITHASISGMLSTLDPHSRYISKNELHAIRAEQHGFFYGVESNLAQYHGGIIVTNITQGGPADKAGVKKGDIIKEIDGQQIANWTYEAATQRLKGENGTVVGLAVQRTGTVGLVRVSVVRSKLPLSSLSHSFMISTTTGFIAIKGFIKTTPEEFERAVNRLKSQGMVSLILDLRGNGGGSLDSAVDICRQLLGPNELVVTQRGRCIDDVIESRTPKNCVADQFPIVVLIDEYSASASEIIAGSIQDHDRGLIVGQTSWGKGVVQTVIEISDGEGLLLSTTRYYTPSGRCIQRSYNNYPDDYLLYNNNDKEQTLHSGPTFKTDLGRVVYGNSGINPDYSARASNSPGVFVSSLDNQYKAFSKFALQEIEQYDARPQQIISNLVMERFKVWLKEQKIEYSEVDWKDKKNQTDIRNHIAAELQKITCDVEMGFRLYSNYDPQVLKALEIMPKSEALLKQRINARNQSLINKF